MWEQGVQAAPARRSRMKAGQRLWSWGTRAECVLTDVWAEEGALLPPRVPEEGSEVTSQSWGCRGCRNTLGCAPGCDWRGAHGRGEGSRVGVLQLPRAWSGWGVWDLAQGLQARFAQGDGRMVLGELGRCCCCCLCPVTPQVLSAAEGGDSF